MSLYNIIYSTVQLLHCSSGSSANRLHLDFKGYHPYPICLGNPKGTPVVGVIAQELRELNFTKIVSLAPKVL
jgi:hypothetical protein